MGSRSRARARAQASEARPGAGAPAAPASAAAASPAAQPDAAPGPLRRPPTITVAVVVQALESVGILAAAVLAGIDTGQGRSYQYSSGIAITAIGLGTAAMLGLVAAGLRRPRRWTRTPALLTQLFTGIVGIYLLESGKYWWGGPAIALSVTGFAVLLAPASTRALTTGLPGGGN